MDNYLDMYDRQQTEHDKHYGDDAPSEFEDGIADEPIQTVAADSRFNREIVKPVQCEMCIEPKITTNVSAICDDCNRDILEEHADWLEEILADYHADIL